ncbi:FAD-dependent monooxygenase [Pseudonocardia sp. CA-107938]|uniref:FAD-dependent monooxygenase n=1 Tax=Pseudonocardia sp. CA-107938 TaxID=3240021 RepID=UPI003D8CB7B1
MLETTAPDLDVPVLIVGGGPVGLTARALLDRWNVPTLLVERYPELSPFPRSRLINVRSMEVFRQLGVAAEITARAFPREYGRIRFSDGMTTPDYATAAMEGVNAPIAESPALGVVTSQDRLEPILVAAADSELRFGHELVDLVVSDSSVLATVLDRAGDATYQVRAGYVVAADGANSSIRQLLGIGTTGPGALSENVTIVFDADLSPWWGDRPAGAYATAGGAFVPVYPEGTWAFVAPGGDGPTEWRDVVVRALGTTDVEVQVLRVQEWTTMAQVADRFADGRVLLAGDAAHAIPPAGGMGMNIGIGDVHNLCWKLAGVVQGWAGPGLLDTYDVERRPVARRTLEQATENAQLMWQVVLRRREQLDAGLPADGQLPWSERYFAQLGQVLGVAYESAAVRPDGSAPPSADPATEYVPVARPGHRMPHLWLPDGSSTLDRLGPWFTLFAAEPAAVDGPWPVHVEPLPAEHLDACGIGVQGAVLVRPDGHVAARWSEGPADVEGVLAGITDDAARSSAAGGGR